MFLIAKELGFDGLEFVPTLKHLFTSKKKLKKIIRSEKFSILSVHQPVWHWPRPTMGMIESLIIFAKDIGARNVVLHLSLLRFYRESDIFPFILFLQEKYNIKVSLENSQPEGLDRAPEWGWQSDEISKLVKKWSVNITLDAPRLAVWSGGVENFYKKNKDKIPSIHIHGTKNKNTHYPISNSEISMIPLLKTLKNKGYNGILTMEVFPRKSAKNISINNIKKVIKKDVELIKSVL